jgi:RNA:NAD 2'-phosphotransferase (TPT1/KptA family)
LVLMISVSSMRTRGMKSFRAKKLVFFKKIN